jgi:hypothetical protein
MHAVMEQAIVFREQLAAWSNALAAGRIGPIADSLTTNCTTQDVNRYLANAIGERERLLQEELSLTALAFVDFPKLVDAYITQTPRTTFELDASDPVRCLQWLRKTQPLTPQQQDFITYQECEYACHHLAQQQRDRYLQFQAYKRWTSAEEARAAILARAPLHLAAVRVAARLSAPALNLRADAACDVIFFAVEAKVQMLCLAAGGLMRLRSLTATQPCTFDAWHAKNKTTNRNKLLEIAVSWGIAGLIAGDEPRPGPTNQATLSDAS